MRNTFSAGQAIVQRLSSGIKRVVAKQKKLLASYNQMCSMPKLDLPQKLCLEDICNKSVDVVNSGCDFNAMKSHYYLIKRSKEEIKHIEQDILATCNFYQKQIFAVQDLLEKVPPQYHTYLHTSQLRFEMLLVQFIEDVKEVGGFQAITPLLRSMLHPPSMTDGHHDTDEEVDVDKFDVDSSFSCESSSDSEDGTDID